MVDYVSGHTFHVPPGEGIDPGWYAQWEEDCDTGEITGPFETEEEAARVFLS